MSRRTSDQTPGGTPSLSAAEHLFHAQRAVDANRPDLVRDHVVAGLAVVTDRETELRLRLTGTGWTLETEGPAAALTELQSLAERTADWPELAALCVAQEAFCHLHGGELVDAAERLNAVDTEVLSPLDRVRVLLNRGTLAGHLEPGAGEDDLRRAYRMAVRERRFDSAFRALHNLGWSAFLRGDLPAALRLMREAGELDSSVDRTVALLDRARVELEAGLVGEARRSLDEAATGAVASEHHHTAAEIDLELARVHLLLGDRPSAVALCRRAHQRFVRLGSDGWADRARIREIAAATPAQLDLLVSAAGDLIDELLRLSAAVEVHGDRRTWLLGMMTAARLSADAGDVARAGELIEALGHAASSRAAYVSTRLGILDLRVRIAVARDDRASSLRFLKRAATELNVARSAPASLDLRTAVAVHARDLADLDLALAERTGRPGAILAASERWRPSGAVLPSVLPPADLQAARSIRELRAVREQIRTARPGDDTKELLVRARRLEQDIRGIDWTMTDPAPPALVAAGGPPERRTPLASLEQHGRGLVSYVPIGGAITAILVPPGGRPRRVDLGATGRLRDLLARVRADVTAIASVRVPGPLVAALHGSLHAGLDDLAAALVAPALRDLPAEIPLVVVPTADLGNVPWGMLAGTRGRPLVVSRSVAAWVSGMAAEANRPSAVTYDVGAIAGPDLPRAVDEVRAVGTMYGTRHRVVDSGDSSAVLIAELLGSCRTVHVAAHGVHDHGAPLFSYVRTHGGPAFAHEFLHDRVVARDVVIAACDGGHATFRPGDEPLGFTATLLSRGVRSVVAPVMAVPDADANQLVLDYHRRLSVGIDPITALAGATAEAPLLAGSFTMFGAG